MSGDPTSNPEFTGVRLGSFQSLAGQVCSAASQLEQLSHALWSELDKLGVSTAPAMKIYAIAQWAQKKGPELQERYQLAQQWNRSGNSGVLVGGYIRIDETKFGDAAIKTRDGQAAAPLARLAPKGDEKALRDLIDKYGSEARNSYFAAALMKALGPKGLVELPASMARHLYRLSKGDPGGIMKQTVQDNAVLLKLLNSSLATATNPKSEVHVGQDFTDALKQQGKVLHRDPEGASYYGYWGLAQILHASHTHTPNDDILKRVPFSTEFLKDIGGSMIDWDRQRTKEISSKGINNGGDGLLPSEVFANGPFSQDQRIPYILNQPGAYPPSKQITSADPLAVLAEAASTNRQAAQALLDYPPRSRDKSNLSYLLHDRREFWSIGDHGDALGRMLESAETGQDKESKRLAVWTSWIRANDLMDSLKISKQKLQIKNSAAFNALSGMRDSMGRILAAHIDDVADSLGARQGKGQDRAGENDVLDNLRYGKSGAHFGTRDLDYILMDATINDNAYRALINAQTGRTRVVIDQAVAHGKGHHIDADIFLGLTGAEAAAFGHILGARTQGLRLQGRTADEMKKNNHDALANLVSTGVGFIPVPGANTVKLAGEKLADYYKKLSALGYQDVTNKLVGNAQGGEEDRDLTKATSNELATYNLLSQMIESSVFDHDKYEHKDLSGQPFMRNGKIEAPKDLSTKDLRAFRVWLAEHSGAAVGESTAYSTYSTANRIFNLNLGLPPDGS